MHPERWKTIEDTYHAALQRPPADRSVYLDVACANDPELRQEVESLLREAAEADRFMEQPAGGLSLALLDLGQRWLEGRELGHYEIGPLIGSGGMAEVYRARDKRLHRDVAIKVLRNIQFLDRERLQRLYREARLLASLNHPNIASIYGIEEADGVCGLVLELVDGETLSERIARRAFSVAQTLDVAKQIAAGLQAAHAKGIIHRDLKPANVKITPDGTVKIVDFGIAKLLHSFEPDNRTDISRQGLVIGTPAYMSPEQTRGKTIDEKTDIWAFGCVLYEMLSGRMAFDGETPTDVIVKIATVEPDWTVIPTLGEANSIGPARLIRKCMEKDPQSRYESVRHIAADIEAIQQGRESPVLAGEPALVSNDDDFVLPVRSAPLLFLLAQAGYLAMYTAAMYHIDAVGSILTTDFGIRGDFGVIATIILALCGVAVRLYLITAVGWRHPAAGRKFTLLFPGLLVFDAIWAASPLLLWRHIGYGLALTGVALLAYVPFSQRTLMRSIYPRHTLRNQTTP
jgi:serine/threonine protein kinase